MLARVAEGGETVAYLVTSDAITTQPRNWSRSLHVGSGVWTGVLNMMASTAILVLLATGVTIWAKRSWRMRANRGARSVPTIARPAR